VKAFARHHKIKPGEMSLSIIPAAPNFMQKDDVWEIVRAIRELPERPGIVFVDTLAQVTPGADENTAKDMGAALANCRAIHQATGVLVVLIHHVGKDATRGARGWSGFGGACDFMLEVSRYGEDRVAKVVKMKNGQDGAEFGFKLVPVVVGQDSKGEDVASCIVEHCPAVPKAQRREPKGALHETVMGVVGEMTIGGPAPVGEVIDEAVNRTAHDPTKKRDTRRQHVLQAIRRLTEQGRVVMDGGNISVGEGAA
jgi:hypothetical protein